MDKLNLGDMIKVSQSCDNVFWTEKRKNFVKLCFLFTPEKNADLSDVDFIYQKIIKKITLDNYTIFCVKERNGKWSIEMKTSFEVDGVIQILVPTTQDITVNRIERLFVKKKCNFNKIYDSFYSASLSNMQNDVKGSIIIAHSNLKQCREFSSCPIDIDPYNLAVYSVDIYGDSIENIDWSFER